MKPKNRALPDAQMNTCQEASNYFSALAACTGSKVQNSLVHTASLGGLLLVKCYRLWLHVRLQHVLSEEQHPVTSGMPMLRNGQALAKHSWYSLLLRLPAVTGMQPCVHLMAGRMHVVRFEEDQTFSSLQGTTLETMNVVDGTWYVYLKGDYAGRVSGAVYDLRNSSDPVKLVTTVSGNNCFHRVPMRRLSSPRSGCHACDQSMSKASFHGLCLTNLVSSQRNARVDRRPLLTLPCW